MTARIYQPAKTAMQSGTAQTEKWVLDYLPEQARQIEPLMGWTGSSDMKSQIKLYFSTKEAAIQYAKKNGIAYRVIEPHKRKHKPKSYSDNFKYGRLQSWTH